MAPTTDDLRAVLDEHVSTPRSDPGAGGRIAGVHGRVRRTRARRIALAGVAAAVVAVGALGLLPGGALRSAPVAPARPTLTDPAPVPTDPSGLPVAGPDGQPLLTTVGLDTSAARRSTFTTIRPKDLAFAIGQRCSGPETVWSLVMVNGRSLTWGPCSPDPANPAGASFGSADWATWGVAAGSPIEVQVMLVDPPTTGSPPAPLPATGPLPAATMSMGFYGDGSVESTTPRLLTVSTGGAHHTLVEGTLTATTRSRTVTATPTQSKAITLEFGCSGDWPGLDVQISHGNEQVFAASCTNESVFFVYATKASWLVAGTPVTLTVRLVDHGVIAEPVGSALPQTQAELTALSVPFRVFEGEPG